MVRLETCCIFHCVVAIVVWDDSNNLKMRGPIFPKFIFLFNSVEESSYEHGKFLNFIWNRIFEAILYIVAA